MDLLKTLKQILTISVISLTGLHSALAIIELQGVPQEETPLILQSFETEIQKHLKSQSHSAPNPTAPVNLKNFYFKFKADSSKALLEIAKAQIAAGRSSDLNLIINEFRRIQADIISRGYEPSENTYWAPPEELLIFQDPTKSEPIPYPPLQWNRPIEHYSHFLNFKLTLNYQPVGHVLKSHEKYPSVFLSGLMILNCKSMDSECIIFNSSFDQTGISWDQIPGPRGGNSSAGGSSSGGHDRLQIDFILNKQEIHKILNQSKKESIPSWGQPAPLSPNLSQMKDSGHSNSSFPKPLQSKQ